LREPGGHRLRIAEGDGFAHRQPLGGGFHDRNPERDGNRQRLRHALPVAHGNGDRVP
jgi:hypothetical protein